MSSPETLNDTLTRAPRARPKFEIRSPKQGDENPNLFRIGVPPQTNIFAKKIITSTTGDKM